MAATMDRTQGLGASDMAAVVGLNPPRWPSALDVYLEKIGEREDNSESEAMFWGRDLEENVARRWADIEGRKVRRVNGTIVHPSEPWCRCHVDRMVVRKEGRGKEGLEVKVSSAGGWGDELTDQIPEHYLPQVHTYIAATGADRWHVAALLWSFGPPRLQRYVVERDDEMIALLMEEGRRFWNEHVVARVPPDPTTSAEANRRWRSAVTGKTVIATQRAIEVIESLQTVKADQKALEERRDALELEIKSLLQDAEAITDEQENPLVTWKSQTSSRFDERRFREEHPDLHGEFKRESQYRVLRFTKRAKELAQEGAA